VLAEKMLQFKLPAAHSMFQQARRRSLARSILLGRAAIFGHKENNGLQDCPRTDCPSGERREGREKPTSQLHTRRDGRRSRKSEISSSGVVELWLGTTSLGVVGLAAAVLTLAAAFFLDFAASRLRGCCNFVLRLLGPGFLTGGGHFKLHGSFLDRLGRGIWRRG
jgi:hypothetical protein